MASLRIIILASLAHVVDCMMVSMKRIWMVGQAHQMRSMLIITTDKSLHDARSRVLYVRWGRTKNRQVPPRCVFYFHVNEGLYEVSFKDAVQSSLVSAVEVVPPGLLLSSSSFSSLIVVGCRNWLCFGHTAKSNGVSSEAKES